jgi:uncharacterized protein (DUF2062 family)
MIFVKKAKELYHKLIYSHATAREVAGGFAIGIFISMTPTLGLHTFLSVGLAALFKKSKIAAIIGCWVVNPATLFPVFYYIYRVGHWVLGTNHVRRLRPESIKDFFHLGGEIIVPLWTGSLVVGTLSAVVSYYLVRWIYPLLKNKANQIKYRLEKTLHPDS